MVLLFAILAVPQSPALRNAAVASAAPVPVTDNDLIFGRGVSTLEKRQLPPLRDLFQNLPLLGGLGFKRSDMEKRESTLVSASFQ